MHGIAQFFGLTSGTGLGYLFWSGAGSDIGELSIVGAAVTFYWQHTCHITRCWRWAKHDYTQDGATYKLCTKHHPNASTLKAHEIK